MRESITLERIKCERCVSRLAEALAPLRGINEARVEIGTSSVIVDYEDATTDELNQAIKKAGFTVISRTPA